MAGLDLNRLHRIRLTRKPVLQRLVAYLFLMPNYRWFPGIEIVTENFPARVDGPVILALNHTDRYNYWPLMWTWYRRHDRYCCPWMKGKYYDPPLLGWIMERLGALPTVSRRYIIDHDMRTVAGRDAAREEYRALRDWMDATGDAPRALIDAPFFSRPRDMLGRPFQPEVETWAEAANDLYRRMMVKFDELHRRCFALDRDLLIYPEGTRSIRIGKGRPGIGQIALRYRIPILPVGVSGSERCYPGASPVARKGRIIYRFGAPIRYEDLAPYHVEEDFIPFDPETEARHREKFQAVADLVIARLNELVDPPYRHAEG